MFLFVILCANAVYLIFAVSGVLAEKSEGCQRRSQTFDERP